MKVIKLILVLYKIKLLSPSSIVHLLRALFHSGMNLMTLLEVATKRYGNRVAIIDDKKRITYTELFLESNRLASYYYSNLHIQKGAKVAFLCRNNIQFIQSIFAVSRIGGDMYLLNSEMGR